MQACVGAASAAAATAAPLFEAEGAKFTNFGLSKNYTRFVLL